MTTHLKLLLCQWRSPSPASFAVAPWLVDEHGVSGGVDAVAAPDLLLGNLVSS